MPREYLIPAPDDGTMQSSMDLTGQPVQKNNRSLLRLV